MKVLIAAACIAVLAFVGYYFWGEYSRYSEQRHAAERLAQQQKHDDCMKALIDFKDGRATSAKDENMARQCAPFINDWYGLPDANKITVDSTGVHMVPLP